MVSAASMLLEDRERLVLAPALAAIAAAVAANAASTLEDELEIELELTLIAARAASTLEDDSENCTLDVWLAVMFALLAVNWVSVENEELERLVDVV